MLAAAAGLRRGQQVNAGMAGTSLLLELEGIVDKDRRAQLGVALRPTYESLPRNANGNLGHQAVRYVLHRLFVQRHGWFIRGLEPGGDNWHASSSPSFAREWLPSYLQSLVEDRLGTHGIDLPELAALAAALEDLVRREAAGRLESAYQLLDLPKEARLSGAQVEQVLGIYMMDYLLGGNFSADTAHEALERYKVFAVKYTGWAEAEAWLRQVEKPHLAVHAQGAELDFAAVKRIVQDIGEQYGHFNDAECRSLKGALLEMEGRHAGRVPLSDFYTRSLHTHWKFNEKKDYLRVIGALDEADPKRPRVIVANYVGSRTNCLEATSIYAVCCRNECEDLMGSLERNIAGPSASPARVAEIVSSLSSDTVQGPRNLSAALLERLEGVAAANGGTVPLHGRLFAQWMHHAFPRECPYPHELGSTNPQTPDEWMKETGSDHSRASEEEMREHVDACSAEPQGTAGAAAGADAGPAELPWTDAEELLVTRPGPVPSEPEQSRGRALPVLALALLLAAVACVLCGRKARDSSRCGAVLLVEPVASPWAEHGHTVLAVILLGAAALCAGLLEPSVVLAAVACGLAAMACSRWLQPAPKASKLKL